MAQMKCDLTVNADELKNIEDSISRTWIAAKEDATIPWESLTYPTTKMYATTTSSPTYSSGFSSPFYSSSISIPTFATENEVDRKIKEIKDEIEHNINLYSAATEKHIDELEEDINYFEEKRKEAEETINNVKADSQTAADHLMNLYSRLEKRVNDMEKQIAFMQLNWEPKKEC